MKLNFFLTILSGIVFITSNAQQADSIKIKADYGSKIEELRLLMDLDRIDYYKLHFDNTTAKNLYVLFTTKEYWNGKVTKVDTLLPEEYAKESMHIKSNDTSFTLSLMTKPVQDSIIFKYATPRSSMERKYKIGKSNNYSLRDGLISNEKFKKVALNTTTPVFVYSLPYKDPKKPNYLFYCALTADGVPPEQWWQKYNISHYIVVEMKILPK